MIAMTTNNSTSVKADLERVFIETLLESGRFCPSTSSFQGGAVEMTQTMNEPGF